MLRAFYAPSRRTGFCPSPRANTRASRRAGRLSRLVCPDAGTSFRVAAVRSHLNGLLRWFEQSTPRGRLGLPSCRCQSAPLPGLRGREQEFESGLGTQTVLFELSLPITSRLNSTGGRVR